MATSRALAIPEILRAIAINIPLFTSTPFSSPTSSIQDYARSPHDTTPFTSTEPGFLPLALLNCCLVCKTWREILVPVLWRCFDERYMWRVPSEIVLRYRGHIRYFRGRAMPLTRRELEEYEQQEQKELVSEDDDKEEIVHVHEDHKKSAQQKEEEEEEQCRSLVELDVFFFRKSGWGKVVHTVPPPAYARVLRQNRHLKKVRLTAHEAKPQPIDATVLSRCLRLNKLEINSFITRSEQDLGRFLSPVVSTLTHLTLIDIRGEYHLDTATASTTPLLWFPHVVEFTTDLSPHITPGIEELIAQCPNLERLCLSPEPSLNLEPLATVLLLRRQSGAETSTCCPKIHSLRFLTSTNEANQIHNVIEACGPLTQLEYKCNNLTKEIQHATRAHRVTLEHLRMSIIFCQPRSTIITTATITGSLSANRLAAGRAQTKFLQEVVDSFLSLRTLAFRDFRQRSSQGDFAETMMEQPWRCNQLEELQLVVGVLEREKDLEMDYFEPGREFAHGWRMPMDVPVDRTYLKPNYVLFERFLDHVSTLPVLRKMTALRVDCVR